jgi:hypothetical protein
MPPVTGYETDDEWEQKTNADYGREWRNWLMLLGMAVGAIAAGIFVFQLSEGKNRAEVRTWRGSRSVSGWCSEPPSGGGSGICSTPPSTRVTSGSTGSRGRNPRRKRRGKHWDIN